MNSVFRRSEGVVKLDSVHYFLVTFNLLGRQKHIFNTDENLRPKVTDWT